MDRFPLANSAGEPLLTVSVRKIAAFRRIVVHIVSLCHVAAVISRNARERIIPFERLQTVPKFIAFYSDGYDGSRTVLLPVNVRGSRPDSPKPREVPRGSTPDALPPILLPAGGLEDCTVDLDDALF